MGSLFRAGGIMTPDPHRWVRRSDVEALLRDRGAMTTKEVAAHFGIKTRRAWAKLAALYPVVVDRGYGSRCLWVVK